PYFALVGGPAVVLNVQEFLARKRAAARERESAAPPPVGAPALSRSRALAVLARAGLLLALLILLALAWPGWLGPDARTLAPSRRVAWRADPDPTLRRLATRLAGWYTAGKLREGEARGFHLQPDFN